MSDKTLGEKIKGVNYYDRRGAYLISIQNNMIAVVKTPKGYFLLGGGIDNNENHIECIKRECIEESGYKVIVKDYIGCAEEYILHNKLGHFHPIQFYYSGIILDKVCEPVEDDHIFEWISIENIEEKMFLEIQGWAVKKYISNNLLDK